MRIICLLYLAGAWLSHADIIHLTSSQTLTGRVFAFTGGMFEYEGDKRATVRLPAGSVQRIDFDGTGAKGFLDTRTVGQLKTKIRRYDKSAFFYHDAKGMELSVPALMVISASFGGGAGKPVEQVTGNDLEKYLVQGRVTIVDFYADWCGPCRTLGPQLEELVKKDPGVVLRKVNVDKHPKLAAKFDVQGIPHVIVYDKDGKSLGSVVGVNLTEIKNLITKGRGKAG